MILRVENPHELSSVVYNYYRTYDPSTGRYLESDPIGLVAGLNTYAYVGNMPTTYFDRFGLTAMTYDVRAGVLSIDPEREGARPYTVNATSGTGECQNESKCEFKQDRGPIPRGDYTIDVSKLSDPNLFWDLLRQTRGDWGDWRVPIDPVPGLDLRGRYGFFLHLGKFPGSAGCIDIGGGILGTDLTDRVKSDLLADPDGIVPLLVK